MKNIGYIRNSRLSQENSVETQTKLITDFCNNNEIHLDEIICDEGISGSGEKTNKRDGYNSVMEMIENGEVNNLIVISISRWGRNLGEIYNSVQIMEKNKVQFLSIKENVDTSSVYGRFTLSLLGSLYEMELELIKERVKDTLKVKKENNKVYSPTPFGYNRVNQDLVENPKEKLMYFSGINNARFKKIVKPGDQLVINAKLLKMKLNTCMISCKITINNKIVCTAEFLSTIVDRGASN